MTKVIAVLIAGVFATAAYAQTETQTQTPAKPAVEKTEVKPAAKKKVHKVKETNKAEAPVAK